MARELGIEVIDISTGPTIRRPSPSAIRELTDGRGTDSAIDAVGMEAHGAPIGRVGAEG